MNLARFNLTTLAQLRGSMRNNATLGERQLAILRQLCDGAQLDLRELASASDVTPGALTGALRLMSDQELIRRIGVRGQYRYGITDKGRARCA